MPIQQLPLIRGDGRNPHNLNYIDRIPVNMLAVQKNVMGAAGYMRSFPGLRKISDVAGVSRGVFFNALKKKVYRVLGNSVYCDSSVIGSASGADRVSLACSENSQAAAINGRMVLFRYDGLVKYLDNWDASTGYSQYDIGSIRDICRVNARYVWLKDGCAIFGITDLEDESKPDRYRAFYTAIAVPDNLIGIGELRGNIVCFGSASIEFFSLTGYSDPSQPVYVPNPALLVQRGIAGTHCKTRFLDMWAFISSASSGIPSVMLLSPGSAQKISTPFIDSVLAEYTADELAQAFLEAIRITSHELLIVHLPWHTFVYDASVKGGEPAWSALKTGTEDAVYRACDFVFDGSVITAADKTEGIMGVSDTSISSQYDKDSEHILFTPVFHCERSRLFDLTVESSAGLSVSPVNMFLSKTEDGLIYSMEKIIPLEKPSDWTRKVIQRVVGFVRSNIGFRLRIISGKPVTLSCLKVRIEP